MAQEHLNPGPDSRIWTLTQPSILCYSSASCFLIKQDLENLLSLRALHLSTVCIGYQLAPFLKQKFLEIAATLKTATALALH